MLFILAGMLAGLLVAGGYFLLRDTMNKIQYVECLHLYWITRDLPTPWGVHRSFMRQTAAPYWRGRGLQIGTGKHSFQFGILTMKVDSLEAQISTLGWLDIEPKHLRKWGE